MDKKGEAYCEWTLSWLSRADAQQVMGSLRNHTSEPYTAPAAAADLYSQTWKPIQMTLSGKDVPTRLAGKIDHTVVLGDTGKSIACQSIPSYRQEVCHGT